MHILQTNLFIFLCFISSLVYSQNTQQLSQTLQQRLDEVREKGGAPGATLGIVLPDGKTIELVSGFSDVESGKAMKIGDRMFSGSIGKTYAMAVVMQLVSEKKLGLDDLASKYLSKTTWFNRLPNASKLTVRMLLNHTGGLPRYVLDPKIWKEAVANPEKIWTIEERLAFIMDAEPVHPAGKGWAYSDTDYILLGAIIEEITGNTYYEEAQKRVLTPLGLKHSSPSNKRKLKGLIPGYTGKEGAFPMPNSKVVEKGKYVINPQLEWTGGGMINTALDLAKWVKLIHEGKAFESSLLKEVQQAVDLQTGQPAEEGYGFANQIYRTKYGLVHGHSGIMPGYLSIMEYLPEYGFSIALQINADPYSGKLKQGYSLRNYLDVLKPLIVAELGDKSATSEVTTLFIVRHAEKASDGTSDPDLNEIGKDRANRLANLLQNEELTAIYSTPYKRNMQTAQPTAEKHSLNIEEYDPRNPAGLFEEILSNHQGGNILITGHSNTVPGLLNILLGERRFAQLNDDEYENFFIVYLKKVGEAKVSRLTF